MRQKFIAYFAMFALSIGASPNVAIAQQPSPAPTESPTPIPESTSTPAPSQSPTPDLPTPTPTPEPTSTPTPDLPTPTPTPESTSTPAPDLPTPTPTPESTSTPAPSLSPTSTPQPSSTLKQPPIPGQSCEAQTVVNGDRILYRTSYISDENFKVGGKPVEIDMLKNDAFAAHALARYDGNFTFTGATATGTSIVFQLNPEKTEIKVSHAGRTASGRCGETLF